MTFTVAGVSTQHGITKVRFANDIVSRTKLLSNGGHNPLELIELPEPMTKADACEYLLKHGGVFAQWKDLIEATKAKKDGTVAKVVNSKPAKSAPKAKAPKAPKIVTHVEEEDFEITEIKELAEAPF
jgi:hypothetical protein